MFNQVWKKYLPVIAILLKKSANGEQVLNMNHTDFERASGGRKMKWSFPVLTLVNGRIPNNGTRHSTLVMDMVSEMQADEQINSILRKQEYAFSMTNDFQLCIKSTTQLGDSIAPASSEQSIH